MGFLDFLFMGALINSLDKKTNKRSSSLSQRSNYNHSYYNGYEDGYEDGYLNHNHDCCDSHDSYDFCDNPDCEYDY